MIRTANNNELNIKNIGETQTLVGWCSKKRNLGGLVFIDLRDRYGITQLVIYPESSCYELASSVKNEFVLKATGEVVERVSKNPNLATGEIELKVSNLEILSTAEQPPFLIQDETDALETYMALVEKEMFETFCWITRDRYEDVDQDWEERAQWLNLYDTMWCVMEVPVIYGDSCSKELSKPARG